MKTIGGGKDYLKTLKGRGKDSRVYYSHQFVGLDIAMLLKDLPHKSLYIKLAKEHNPQKLLELAKSVMERRDVQNPGAYFMGVIANNANWGGNNANENRNKKSS